VHLGEILDQAGEIIKGVGALRMAGDLDDLGGRQPGADPGPFLLDPAAESGDLFFPGGILGGFEVLDLLFQRKDIFFKP
jgi:hypothetical protein